jgi:3-hydroxyacyl-CoA dehydrogenase/enoyl-CoA hydratase/3-hydroxybutyryl-CoA epimerase
MKELVYRLDGGIAIVGIDSPGPVNTIGARLVTDLHAVAARAAADGARGLVLASAKRKSFLDGANLLEIAKEPSVPDLRHLVLGLQEAMAALARAPFPVVAVLEGQSALGGGLELLLWSCDHVVASTGSRMGLPEVNVGLFPAAGGCETLRRLLGLEQALDFVLRGRIMPAEFFVASGLVTMVEAGRGLEEAIRWIDAHPSVTNRNTDPAREEPGGLGPDEKRAIVAAARRRHAICPEKPWIPAALDAIEEGLDLPLEEAASRAAARFAPLIVHPNVRNKIDLFFLTTSVAPRLVRVDEARAADRIAVIGAGLMGQGIAQVCADAGIDVLLYDVDEARARAGKEAIASSLEPLVAKGRWLPERRDGLLARIDPTTDHGLLAGVDLAVESVFEDLDLKRRILASVQEANPEVVFASNTSTLPMDEIAEGSARPEQVVGMHYFSPVPLMPLLEVIRGPRTSARALATAVASGRRQGKTLIVVGDGPGFYTSRTFGVYVLTGFFLAESGLDPWEIDRLALEAGFPQGPLHVYGTAGGNVITHAARAMHERMPDAIPLPESLGRMHEAGYVGAGKPCFYRKGMEPDPTALEHVVRTGAWPSPAPTEVKEMLILSMVNQAFLCLDAGVVGDYASMELGAILGVGFPDCWHGPARYVSQKGVRATRARLAELLDRTGLAYFRPARELDRIAACGVDRGLI